MSGADLSNVQFSEIYLDGANLSEANLSLASFDDNVYLRGANLSNANLTGANLTGVCGLSKANLSGAKLIAALYSYCADSPAEFDLTKAGAILVGEGADLSGMDLSNVRLHTCCKLSEVNFSHTNLSGAILHGNDLTKANFSFANLFGADLGSTDLNYADLSNANLVNADLRNANLANADLRNAKLNQTTFQCATFCHTIMPDGSVRNDNCEQDSI